MIFSLHIQARSHPAMLEKILQTTRVRGFAIRAMDVKSNDDECLLKVHLTVESERPQERLVAQLHKLGGIQELTALHAVADPVAPAARSARNLSVMCPA